MTTTKGVSIPCHITDNYDEDHDYNHGVACDYDNGDDYDHDVACDDDDDDDDEDDDHNDDDDDLIPFAMP